MSKALGSYKDTHLRRSAFYVALCGALILVASLVNYLTHHQYPIFSPEIAIIIAGFVAASALFGLLYLVAGEFGRIILEVFLVYFALDLHFSEMYVFIGAVIALIILRHRLVYLFGIIAATVLISAMLGFNPSQTAKNIQAQAPLKNINPAALLHIILDEHIGTEGLDAANKETASLRDAIKSFYVDRSFYIYGGAYSEYLHTRNAIPHILNFGAPPDWQPESKKDATLPKNAYFDQLRSQGFRLKIYQTDFLDYCFEQEVSSCTQHTADDPGPVAVSSLATGDKAQLIFFSFAARSDGFLVASWLYDTAAQYARAYSVPLPLIWANAKRHTTPVAALRDFENLIGDLSHAEPGDAYFAHILLPHFPYAVKPDCSLNKADEWMMRRSTGVIKQRQQAYAAQIKCVFVKVEQALQALDRSPAGKDTIVIIHGDHGSRITQIDPAMENEGRFTDDDMIAGYSTLFAVRATGMTPGYDAQRLPAAQILTTLARSQFRSHLSLPPGYKHSVVLEDASWKPMRRYDMPKSWLMQPVQ